MPVSDLTQRFKQHFSIGIAATPSQLSDIFLIRHNVFCEEFQYFQKRPSQKEQDEFDAQSIHCLITQTSTALPAGCLRLVMTDETHHLPFENYCKETMDPAFGSILKTSREIASEISRLAVNTCFRRRRSEAASRYGNPTANFSNTPEARRTFPLISTAACLAGIALSSLAGRQFIFAVMEPSLSRLLSRAGIYFRRAGCDFNYCGQRTLYFIERDTIDHTMKAELKTFYAFILSEITRTFNRKALPLGSATPRDILV